MELTLTPEQTLFRDTTREFLEKESPLTRVRELAETPDGFTRGWWRRGAELGWTSLVTGDGGLTGSGVCDLAIAAEEMGRLVAPGPLVPVNVVAHALAEAENAADHADVIDGLVSGATLASWAVSEDGGATRAERDGSDLVLTGTKDRVEAGAQAGLLLVTAQADDGPVQVLVPADAPGVTVTQVESLDLVRRFARVDLDRVRVPAAARVRTPEGAVGRQFRLAVVLQCAELVGVMDRVFAFTRQWAADRYSFGRPLDSYQALKHRFADMHLWLEACAATAAAAARAVDTRDPDAAELVSVAKAYIGPHATDLVQDCVQLHGGIGVTWEHDLHLYLRRATVDRVTWGTPSEHRRRIAGILRL